jgi:hypothetical protein
MKWILIAYLAGSPSSPTLEAMLKPMAPLIVQS